MKHKIDDGLNFDNVNLHHSNFCVSHVVLECSPGGFRAESLFGTSGFTPNKQTNKQKNNISGLKFLETLFLGARIFSNSSPTVTKFSNHTVNSINITEYLNFCVCASMYPCVFLVGGQFVISIH